MTENLADRGRCGLVVPFRRGIGGEEGIGIPVVDLERGEAAVVVRFCGRGGDAKPAKIGKAL